MKSMIHFGLENAKFLIILFYKDITLNICTDFIGAS